MSTFSIYNNSGQTVNVQIIESTGTTYSRFDMLNNERRLQMAYIDGTTTFIYTTLPSGSYSIGINAGKLYTIYTDIVVESDQVSGSASTNLSGPVSTNLGNGASTNVGGPASTNLSGPVSTEIGNGASTNGGGGGGPDYTALTDVLLPSDMSKTDSFLQDAIGTDLPRSQMFQEARFRQIIARNTEYLQMFVTILFNNEAMFRALINTIGEIDTQFQEEMGVENIMNYGDEGYKEFYTSLDILNTLFKFEGLANYFKEQLTTDPVLNSLVESALLVTVMNFTNNEKNYFLNAGSVVDPSLLTNEELDSGLTGTSTFGKMSMPGCLSKKYLKLELYIWLLILLALVALIIIFVVYKKKHPLSRMMMRFGRKFKL